MKLPQAILFDWDETLARTRNAVTEAIEYTLQKFGKEPWHITKIKYRDTAKSFKENFPNFFGQKAGEAYQCYLDYYQKHCFPKVTASENAVEFLDLCRSKNIQTYIISNKEKTLLLHEVKQCFPRIAFEKILGNGDAPHNKPDAAPVFAALKNSPYPVTSETVWLIGDSRQDIDCAYNAGIRPILLGKGTFTDKIYLDTKLNANPPLCIFDNFNELTIFLKTLS